MRTLINNKNNFFIMHAKFIKESIEYPDSYEDSYEDVENIEDDNIETPFDLADISDEDEDETSYSDELELLLNNELKIPEYARKSFSVQGVDAVPMARMRDGSFLMKVGNVYRKFKF